MAEALLVIGFLAAIAGIVLLIIALVKKKGWGVARSLAILGVGVIMFIVGGIMLPKPEAISPGTPSETPALITQNASELVLAVEDFEPGWVQQSAKPVTKEGAQSAYHVYFYKGTFYPTVVQNTVAVYPSIDLAKQVYLGEKPQNVSLEYPKVGNECFLNIAVPENQRLVFRTSNVVVWLWLQQDMFGDVKSYARIIEGKI